MDSRDRSPVQVQHMSLPHLLSSPETILQSMSEQTTETPLQITDSAMSTIEQETIPAAAIAATAEPPVADTPRQEESAMESETTPAVVPVVPEEQRAQPDQEQSAESTPQPQRPAYPESATSPQSADEASPPAEAAPTQTGESEPSAEVGDSLSPESQPTETTPTQTGENETTDSSADATSPEPQSTENSDTPTPETIPESNDSTVSTPADSQPSDPEPAPPPAKPEIPEWVTWEDDLSTPSEEELAEVKDTEVENDALNVAAREKQVFTDHDDPDQRPAKKIRLSWIIKGVRGTKGRPNRARTMNSPAAYIDGLYWTIKFFPRGNKCSSISAYIQCSREKPQPDKEVPESTFTYFEGPPDADLGQSAEPIKRIQVEATPQVKSEEKVNVEEDTKEASASNDSTETDDEIKPAADVTSSEEEQDFRCSAQLGMVIYNPDEPRTATCHTSEHQFCPKNSDWGWTNFVGKWDEIHVRKRGERQALLRNDTIGIDAYIRVFDDPTQALWWHGSHDNESNWPSKLLAGYFPMGTPPLYHSPAVAGITTWLLLAPFRDVLQNVDTSGWRTDSQVKPRPFISRLQVILHQMRHMKNDDYVNVYPAIETLRDAGENYNDVKAFWEAFRRGIELELEGDTESLQKVARIFDVEDKKYALPALPVRGVGDVETALSMIKQPADLPADGPDFLPLMLEREAFDKISREWKMHHDRVTLNDELTLPFGNKTKYSLYGFVVHVGTRNSGRFYSILRPNGPGTKWLAFEDGDGNKVFSYTRKEIQEYEGLTGDELDNFTSTRQTAYLALYIKTDKVAEYLPGSLESYDAPKWLKKACDLQSTDEEKSDAEQDVVPKPDSVAFEVYHDACAVGRQGLLDMFNVKQFDGNRRSFRSWALPAKTTIKELREQLSMSMGLATPDKLRVFSMLYGEVGQYGNAMWVQLTLDATLGSLATDVRPLCLWTATLQTDEDVQLFKMPEPVLPSPPVDDDSSDEDEPSSGTVPDLDVLLGGGAPGAVLTTEQAAELGVEVAVAPTTDGGATTTPNDTAEPQTQPETEPVVVDGADSATLTESTNQSAAEAVAEHTSVSTRSTAPDTDSTTNSTAVPGQTDMTATNPTSVDGPTTDVAAVVPDETGSSENARGQATNAESVDSGIEETPASANETVTHPAQPVVMEQSPVQESSQSGTDTQTTAEATVEATAETTAEITVETTTETPAEASHEDPAEAAVETPAEGATVTTAETPAETAGTAVESAPESAADIVPSVQPTPAEAQPTNIPPELSATQDPASAMDTALNQSQPSVSPAEDTSNAAVVTDSTPEVSTEDDALPVEHGHLVDAMIENPESTDGSAVVQAVVAVVADTQAAISPEDEAAIAALIAEDTAALNEENSEVAEQPAAETSPSNDHTEDSTPEATEETAAAPDSTEDSGPEPPKPCVYGFLQRFEPENQTFKVSQTFFAPRDAPVREYIQKLLKYEDGQAPHIWYRTTHVEGSPVGDSETFNDIHFVDGVDLIVGPVLSEETITEMRSAGKFWEPFGLSRFLRMQERKHPQAITTAPDHDVEHFDFGGQYYKGPLVNGRQHGASCEIIYANGQTYSGPLRCNLRHGAAGKMVYQNGDTYEGEWAEDEQHGQGTFLQKRTGNKYVGGFVNGKRWGKGTTLWEVADEEADLCQICYGEEIDALFFDCGHVCSCVECAKQCETCPICRRSVKQVVKMYRV